MMKDRKKEGDQKDQRLQNDIKFDFELRCIATGIAEYDCDCNQKP